MNRYFIALTAMLLACSSSPRRERVRETRVSIDGPVRMQTGQSALDAFIPLRDAVVDGGECAGKDTTDTGLVRMTATFPARKTPDTSITVWLFPDDRVARYSEGRGVPPAGMKIEQIQEAMRSITRTIVQLDYVTGEGLIMNAPANGMPSGFHGRVTSIEKSGKVGDIRTRVSIVKTVCAKGRTEG